MADNQTSDTTSSSTGTSSGSQSVPSSASMESGSTAPTLPTQDIVDGMSDEDEARISIWGRLFPLGIGFEKVGKMFCTCNKNVTAEVTAMEHCFTNLN